MCSGYNNSLTNKLGVKVKQSKAAPFQLRHNLTLQSEDLTKPFNL